MKDRFFQVSGLFGFQTEVCLLFSEAPANELVVDGDSLVFALDPKLQAEFIELCCSCQSVICCRVSPLQKAEMVELVQVIG